MIHNDDDHSNCNMNSKDDESLFDIKNLHDLESRIVSSNCSSMYGGDVG